jgi:hypothetical protein
LLKAHSTYRRRFRSLAGKFHTAPTAERIRRLFKAASRFFPGCDCSFLSLTAFESTRRKIGWESPATDLGRVEKDVKAQTEVVDQPPPLRLDKKETTDILIAKSRDDGSASVGQGSKVPSLTGPVLYAGVGTGRQIHHRKTFHPPMARLSQLGKEEGNSTLERGGHDVHQ